MGLIDFPGGLQPIEKLEDKNYGFGGVLAAPD
jgi:hypothetical protein